MAHLPDPIYWTIWADIVSRLEGMRVGEGYHLDYGEVLQDAPSLALQDSDFSRPKVGLEWPGDESKEMAAAATERTSEFRISVPVRDDIAGRHMERMYQVHADVDKAMLETILIRTRGVNNAATWSAEVDWRPIPEGGQGNGGTLFLKYTVRFNHTTGDLGTVR